MKSADSDESAFLTSGMLVSGFWHSLVDAG